MMLLLVRHAMPASGPEQPPHQWALSEEGHLGADSLRSVLPPGAVLISSQEPKARQTLEPAGRVRTDGRFNEVARDEPYDEDHRARRLAYVTGTDHPGWEPRGAVIARFDAGVRWWQRVAGPALVIGSHGMAMTLWLGSLGLIDHAGFWSTLRLPDVFEVDPDNATIRRIESASIRQLHPQ